MKIETKFRSRLARMNMSEYIHKFADALKHEMIRPGAGTGGTNSARSPAPLPTGLDGCGLHISSSSP